MIQLELDPRFMQPKRFSEIEAARNQILRRRVTGGGGEWRKERRLAPISFDKALQSLLNSAYHTLERETNARGYELDLLVGRVLRRSLPYLQGEKESDFETLGDFKRIMFYPNILEHIIIDSYQSESRSHKETQKPFPPEKNSKSQQPMETTKRKTEGFQPTLFRLSEEQTGSEKAIGQLLADLKNPDRVLGSGSDYLRKSPIRRVALELKWQNPQFSSEDVAQILVFTRLQKVC